MDGDGLGEVLPRFPLRKDLLPHLLVVLSADGLQLSYLSGMASAAESCLLRLCPSWGTPHLMTYPGRGTFNVRQL